MPDMAKKKPKPKNDRHKPRAMIFLPPRLHEQLSKLAQRNDRPLSWEARRIIQAALEEAGLWPPPPPSAES